MCVPALLIAVYVIQCLSPKCVCFVIAANGFTDSSTSSETVDCVTVAAQSISPLPIDDSRYKAHVSTTRIPQVDSNLKAPTTQLTNTQTSKEPEIISGSSQSLTISSCKDVTNVSFASALSPCSTNVNDGQIIADCSGLSLDIINPTWFPTNTNVILFINNRLKTIDNCTFSHLRDLRTLNLYENRIDDLQAEAFSGLNNLESLNLEDNKLGLKYLYPPDVFRPLTKLKELLIMKNLGKDQDDGCIPGDILGKLTHLESLSVDTFGEKLCFNEEFAELQYLQQLDIYGDSASIDERSFENVRQIKSLHIKGVVVTNFSDVALEPLQKLDVLSWEGVRLGVENSLRAMKPLRGRNMTVISFDSIDVFEHDRYAGFIKNDGVLNYSKTRHLLEICVRNFSLTSSHIYVVESNAFSGAVWDKCLVTLDLSDNPLLGTKIAFIRILNFKNIETIIIDYIFQDCVFKTDRDGSEYNQFLHTVDTISMHHLSSVTTHNNDNNTIVHNTNVNDGRRSFNNMHSVPADSRKQVVDTCTSAHSTPEYIWLTVSTSLQSVHMHASISNTKLDKNVKFIGATSVMYLDLSRGKLSEFQGNITGLDALQTFILSGNDASVLSETFFDNFCNLEELLLSDCQLDVDFISRSSTTVLKYLSKLKRLDLSFNLLNSLASDAFIFNTQLEVLNLAKNRFRTIPFNLWNTPNLKILDLSKNSLTSIESRDREMLDTFADQPGGFYLLLSGNDISCDCNNFPFLRWLTTTHVQFDEVHIACPDDNMNATNVGLDVERFYRKCLGGFFLTLAISLCLLMIIGFLVFFFVRKHTIFLKSAILQFFTGYKLKVQSDYRIGVYIGYSERDYEFPCFHLSRFIEDELNLTTYVFHRDMSGTDMPKSIVDAINASWRIVLVVTSSFLYQDEWSAFIYTSAIYSQTTENPSRIVVLVDSSLQHHLPPELLSTVSDDNIIVVPEWELTYELRHQLRARLIQ
ncbi:hypothetical protein BsWGS_12383 [Bradybaena similaris]